MFRHPHRNSAHIHRKNTAAVEAPSQEWEEKRTLYVDDCRILRAPVTQMCKSAKCEAEALAVELLYLPWYSPKSACANRQRVSGLLNKSGHRDSDQN
ncbi:MAG: hypothetical protein K2X38_13530, partial [Gemmataceae bacterium]|nr:hypothetical protein [Gemmataceae bacterium]